MLHAHDDTSTHLHHDTGNDIYTSTHLHDNTMYDNTTAYLHDNTSSYLYHYAISDHAIQHHHKHTVPYLHYNPGSHLYNDTVSTKVQRLQLPYRMDHERSKYRLSPERLHERGVLQRNLYPAAFAMLHSITCNLHTTTSDVHPTTFTVLHAASL
jgi:hypothetical protein